MMVVGPCGTYRQDRIEYRDLVGKHEREVPLEDLGLGGSIILKCIQK
jgi:hypothetical protein